MVRTLDECRRNGYASTLLGRRRSIQGVRPIDQLTLLTEKPSRRPLTLPERTAVNSVIQGTAADMIKLAMINIHRELVDRKLKSRMLLQVHDELVFDLYIPEKEQVLPLVEDKMKQAIKLPVPIEVEMGVGKNWLEAH